MNTKIKELINKVGTDVSGKWVGIDNVELLAELIVKECVNVGQDAFLHGSTVPVFPTIQIKRHFGVE
jgi:hypothetical protein